MHDPEQKTCDSAYWNCQLFTLAGNSRIVRVTIGYYVETTYTKVASMSFMQSNGDPDIEIGAGKGDFFETFDFLNKDRLIGLNSYIDGYPEIYKVEVLRSNGFACAEGE